MKFTKQVFLTISLIFAAPVLSAEPPTGSLIVHIIGFKNNKGEVKIALARSKQELDKMRPYKVAKAKITDKNAQWAFPDLPYGEYVVMLYHDENVNGVLDKYANGKPKEGYGFSNNSPAYFGPPKYSKMKFIINKGKTEMTIKLVY
jgi:uncharacterized protein (DUF2141 family)